ncbi:MAG: TRAP transporter substrate-binding protein [Acidobacteria bacterium]|nr:TRAP transporter substrate-binding protein [Acidobacteriota bacterium]
MRHILILVAITLLNACGESDSSGLIKLQLGHVSNPGALVAESANEFARRVNEKLAGRVTVNVFGSSQLGTDEVLLQKLKLGTVDLALPSTVMSTVVDEFGLFEMPYLVEDREHMKRIEKALFWPRLAPLSEAKGYRVLAVWENGFRHITNNDHPIRTPADLRGIKLRTPKGRWRIKMFQAYGANPTPMPLSEVFVALQTGVMDGEENPLSMIYSSKFQEVQKYLSLSQHVYTPAYLLAGAGKWPKLPEDVRQILETTARETQEFVHRRGKEIDEELLVQLKAEGMEINEVDRDAFKQAGQDIYKEFGAAVKDGDELTSKAIALRDGEGRY